MVDQKLLQMLGLDDQDRAFERHYDLHGMPRGEPRGEGKTTVPLDGVFRNLKVLDRFEGLVRNYVINRQQQVTQTKAMDGGVVGGNTAGNPVPLEFDPEILSILKADAPHKQRIPTIGQAGFKAVVNRIDSRDAALGFQSESAALDLVSDTESDIGFGQIEVDMEIWLDKVSLSDFARVASQHYMPLRDTTLGERIANYAQETETAILYADPTQGLTSGGIGDADAYTGYEKIITDAGNRVDKSTVDLSGTDAILKDIKSEITAMLQGQNNVRKQDLEIWTSHTMFDELENELGVKRRIEQDVSSVNFGFEMISIKGIPVVAGHNVDEHTDGGFTTGSEGDVFVMNRREMQWRALAPLSIIPLGRRGLSEQLVAYEFGAPVLRADGNLCRYLDGYAI